MLRTPPLSALFPYTTLFRSDEEQPRQRVARHPRRFDVLLEIAGGNRLVGEQERQDAGERLLRERGRCGGEQRPHGERGDRKSTRLNSSHLVISYAVFCLKKK